MKPGCLWNATALVILMWLRCGFLDAMKPGKAPNWLQETIECCPVLQVINREMAGSTGIISSYFRHSELYVYNGI